MLLEPTNGHIIAGSKIDEHRFLGRVKASQLFQIAPDPRDSENKKKVDASHELQELRDMRDEVQRFFEGAKKKNVPNYAEYIVALAGGQDGITPPITLYSEGSLSVEELSNGTALIQVPWEIRLVAIDGETQLAARHEAANIAPETKQEFVAVYICHGHDKHWARQAFHDLNTLAVRPNIALSIGMDARDPITHICREVERRVPFFKDRVNKQRRQLRATDAEVVTIAALRSACVTLAKGIAGIQYGARPVPIEKDDLPAIESTAIDWFTALTNAIGPAMSDKVTKLAAAPATLAALGAIGNEALALKNPAERKAKCDQLAYALRSVNWERGQSWEGIAGKFTPKGAFAVGGPKENSYAIYSALSDPASSGYAKIRVAPAVAA